MMEVYGYAMTEAASGAVDPIVPRQKNAFEAYEAVVAAGVIVPNGVLFGSGKAARKVREMAGHQTVLVRERCGGRGRGDGQGGLGGVGEEEWIMDN